MAERLLVIEREWDSAFWRVKIGQAEHLPDANPHGFDCAWLLIPATDQGRIQQAEEHGAFLTDIRVEYARTTSPEVGISRPAAAADMDALAGIARTAFRGLTRFYADPFLNDLRCDYLYEGWLHENFDDPLVAVLMVGDGDSPAGFVTVKFDGDLASIVLIAVAEQHRGRGLGLNLTHAAVNYAYLRGFPKISVVTQGCNMASQRAFQAAGFRITEAAVWLHKWYA